MRRKLLNFTATISLLLFVLSCAMWVRSYWRTDYVIRTTIGPGPKDSDRYVMTSDAGRLMLRHEHIADAYWPRRPEDSRTIVGSSPPDRPEFRDLTWQAADVQVHLGVARWYRTRPQSFGYDTGISSGDYLDIFYWPVAAASGFIASWYWWRERRRRRRASGGCCPTCGYDLRATPDRCPECGAVSQPPRTAV